MSNNESSLPASLALSRGWLRIARISWLAVATFSLVIFVAGMLARLVAEPPSCIDPASTCLPGAISREDIEIAAEMGFNLRPIGFLSDLLARVSVGMLGILIFIRMRNDWVAMLFSLSIMTVLVEGGYENIGILDRVQDIILLIGTVLFMPVPFIFPNGRVEPPFMRKAIIPISIAAAFGFMSWIFTPVSGVWSALASIIWGSLAIVSLVYRFRAASNPVERQQIKWIVLGLGAAVFVGMVFSIISSIYPVNQPSPGRIRAMAIPLIIYPLGYGFFAYAIFVAMTRHRLWDFDWIIRRTLQYSLLTGVLGLVYFGSVVMLQSIAARFFGATESPVVTVLSTLILAALFNPLRTRFQWVIDRRFYRTKYNLDQALIQFSFVAREEVDLERLCAEIMTMVDRSLQPQKISLNIDSGQTLQRHQQ